MKHSKVSKLITGLTTLGFLLFIATSCGNEKKQLIDDQSKAIAQLEQEIDSKEEAFEDILNLLDEAEAQMVTITKRETMVANTRENQKQKREQLLEQIQLIDNLIANSSAKIEALSEKIKESDLRSVALQKRVKGLVETLESKDVSIASLKAELLTKEEQLALTAGKYDSLQLKTAEQKINLHAREQQIKTLEATNGDLNKVHYVVGSPKELKERGLVDKEGGLFGIFGKATTVAPAAEQSEFIEIDIHELKELPLSAKKVELISEHPADSYEIVEDEIEKDIQYLKITDPEAFWKASKLLVISVKS